MPCPKMYAKLLLWQVFWICRETPGGGRAALERACRESKGLFGSFLMSEIEPRLVAVRGPLKGSILLLPEGEYTVGRQSTNNLYLEDHAVSRQQCVFTRSGANCTLKDLESRNGTFINGASITEQQLTQGDEIRIGASVFLYLVTGDRLGRTPHSDSKTRELRVQDSISLSSGEHSPLPPSFRAMQDRRTLLRVSTMLHSWRGLQWTHGTPVAEV